MADDNANTAPVATEKPTEATKPEFIQDKFWDPEKMKLILKT